VEGEDTPGRRGEEQRTRSEGSTPSRWLVKAGDARIENRNRETGEGGAPGRRQATTVIAGCVPPAQHSRKTANTAKTSGFLGCPLSRFEASETRRRSSARMSRECRENPCVAGSFQIRNASFEFAARLERSNATPHLKPKLAVATCGH
jgi:hypothetical protein